MTEEVYTLADDIEEEVLNGRPWSSIETMVLREDKVVKSINGSEAREYCSGIDYGVWSDNMESGSMAAYLFFEDKIFFVLNYDAGHELSWIGVPRNPVDGLYPSSVKTQ
ncbi:hypothetical protein HN662_03570 [Candidatus Woesearchaeota archaeon]|jgi:hypothetical protein|nr:hypothetical protein [Candidatus Woesearchaeota archaeon]